MLGRRRGRESRWMNVAEDGFFDEGELEGLRDAVGADEGGGDEEEVVAEAGAGGIWTSGLRGRCGGFLHLRR